MSDSVLSPGLVSVGEDRSFLKSLPEKPGIYIFRNRTGDVLYVGKALRLRSRGAQLFCKKDWAWSLDSENGGGIHHDRAHCDGQ